MQLGWLRIVIIGASVSIMLFAMSWLILKERGNPVDGPKGGPPVKGVEKIDPDKNKVEAKEPEKPREDPAVLEEKRAIVKMRLTAVLDLKSEIGETLTTLEHEITAWETRIPPLMKSVDGKKIAANSTRAEQFAGVLEKDRVSKMEVKRMREKLHTLIAPIERAILDEPPSVTVHTLI